MRKRQLFAWIVSIIMCMNLFSSMVMAEEENDFAVIEENAAGESGENHYCDTLETYAAFEVANDVIFEEDHTSDTEEFEIVPAESSGITLNKTKAEIATKSTLTLKASGVSTGSITWTSSKPAVATVDKNGKVTAKIYGKTVITAAAAGQKATCAIQTRFFDVNDSGKAYYKPVYWAVDEGITRCTVSFRPDDTVTRGEFVAFLYRLADSPKVTKYTSKFNDVNSDTKFYKEINWGVNEGIIKGFSDGSFKPEDTLTRSQAAKMIWRYAGEPAVSTTKSPFKDVASGNTENCKTVVWGSQNGIIKGYSDGTFHPNQPCTRGHVVTFLYRYNDIKDKLNTWNRAYYSYLNNHKNDYANFELLFFDSDDTPEMALREKTGSDAKVMLVTYVNGKVKEIGRYGYHGRFEYFEKQSVMITQSGSSDDMYTYWHFFDSNYKRSLLACTRVYVDSTGYTRYMSGESEADLWYISADRFNGGLMRMIRDDLEGRLVAGLWDGKKIEMNSTNFHKVLTDPAKLFIRTDRYLTDCYKGSSTHARDTIKEVIKGY